MLGNAQPDGRSPLYDRRQNIDRMRKLSLSRQHGSVGTSVNDKVKLPDPVNTQFGTKIWDITYTGRAVANFVYSETQIFVTMATRGRFLHHGVLERVTVTGFMPPCLLVIGDLFSRHTGDCFSSNGDHPRRVVNHAAAQTVRHTATSDKNVTGVMRRYQTNCRAKADKIISTSSCSIDHYCYPVWSFLADRTIGRAFATECRLSVCLSVCRLSVTFCILAKRYVLAKNCLKEQIGLPPETTNGYQFGPPIPPLPLTGLARIIVAIICITDYLLM